MHNVGSCEASSLVQSLESMEQKLLPMRKQLHQLLGLPMDRPMLHMANALPFGPTGRLTSGIQLAGLLKCLAACMEMLPQRRSTSCKGQCFGQLAYVMLPAIKIMLIESRYPGIAYEPAQASAGTSWSTGCCRADAEGGSQYLKDVHHGLPPSGVQKGTVHMVEGSYDYHHYMQVCLYMHLPLLTLKQPTLE